MGRQCRAINKTLIVSKNRPAGDSAGDIATDTSRDTANSFSPVAGAVPRVLILGSVPGQASLQAVQYYAHPRNAFWPIALAAIHQTPLDFKAAHRLAYADKTSSLTAAGIALWDVLATCHRPGSLDSRIDRASEVVNPITNWLIATPSVKRVCFNGKAAAAIFQRHIYRSGKPPSSLAHIEFMTLPSTSPAHASMSLTDKAKAWRPAFL